MKKTLVAVCVLLMLFSFPTISYAKWGIGVEGIELYDAQGYSPFISFDPTPMLQLRVGGYYSSYPKTEENDEPDTSTDFFISGIYRFWKGDFSPYIGARIGVYNWHSVYLGTIYRNVETSGSLLFGIEWSILNNISLFINTDLLDAYTVIDKEGAIVDSKTTGIGNNFYLGAVIYL
ncbi:MAG: hypothetical protein NT030_02605 [Candidatus Saganbacteria bacterium]|nr:hypothetical protein [Candidatus Saganbacteria bacterium]